MDPTAAICTVPGCEDAVASFAHFPTIIDLCSLHGGQLRRLVVLLDAPPVIGFDGHRARWEITMRDAGQLPVR